MDSVDLSIELAGIKLKNPVLNASGTIGVGSEELIDLAAFGALVTKGITLKARAGSPLPRICETFGGMINSIGLENSGLDAFIKNELPFWLSFGVPVIANISGADAEEYAQLAKKLTGAGVAGLEINISCPNREGVIFGQEATLAHKVVWAVQQATSLPLIVKLTPNEVNNAVIAQAVRNAGADAVSLINTYFGRRYDIETGKPKIGRGFGGVSGPAILALALDQVWRVRQAVSCPLIGLGGISCPSDAVEFLLAGADAVALGTVNFSNPKAVVEVIAGLKAYCERKGYKSIREIPRAEFPGR